jgi:hypothetical protein
MCHRPVAHRRHCPLTPNLWSGHGMCRDVISSGVSGVPDEGVVADGGPGDVGEGQEVLGFAFVAAVSGSGAPAPLAAGSHRF